MRPINVGKNYLVTRVLGLKWQQSMLLDKEKQIGEMMYQNIYEPAAQSDNN